MQFTFVIVVIPSSRLFFLSLFGCDSGSEGIRSKSWFSSVVVRVPSPSSHFSFSSNLMQANFRICLHLSAWNIHRWLTLGTLQRINGKIKESKHHIHWRCTQEWTVYILIKWRRMLRSKIFIYTLATDELLCMKNAGTKISMLFTSNEDLAPLAIEKIKILGAVLELELRGN